MGARERKESVTTLSSVTKRIKLRSGERTQVTKDIYSAKNNRVVVYQGDNLTLWQQGELIREMNSARLKRESSPYYTLGK
jgi:hypothetical protein